MNATSQVLNEARKLAALINSPECPGDRCSISMRLSVLQKKLGAIGTEAALDNAANEQEVA